MQITDLVKKTEDVSYALLPDTDYIAKLKAAGFTKAAEVQSKELSKLKRERRALKAGYSKLPVEAVNEFRLKLQVKGLTYSITPIEEYLPANGEMIPVEEIEKVQIARARKLFKKMLVVGVAAKPDPIVVGVLEFLEYEEKGYFANSYGAVAVPSGPIKRISYDKSDWYFIAGWK